MRDVPDEVYQALAEAAASNRQSLSSYVVERLTEIARLATIAGYLDSYVPPVGSGLTTDDAVAAVRAVRDAS